MAALQTLRNNAGILLLVFIGLALLSFILGSFLDNPRVAVSSTVGTIDGEEIDYAAYQNEVDQVERLTAAEETEEGQNNAQRSARVRMAAWDGVIYSYIARRLAEDLGIQPTKEDILQAVVGQGQIPPALQKMFTDPSTGQFDGPRFVNQLVLLGNEDTLARYPQLVDLRDYWLAYENQLKRSIALRGYFSMVRKGLNVSLAEGNFVLEAKKQRTNLNILSVPFSSISDSMVTTTQRDFQAYYDKHKARFKQPKEERMLNYVLFRLVPSVEDTQAALKEIMGLKEQLKSASKLQEFVRIHSSDRQDRMVLKKKEDYKNKELAEWAFNGQRGDIYGPALYNGKYVVAKIDTFDFAADSVKASHILISPRQRGITEEVAGEIADSLLQTIRSDSDFIKLATTESADRASALNGGLLGWFQQGTMVKEFDRFCFSSPKGKKGIVKTAYGYHIIKIDAATPKVRKARIAIISHSLRASGKTRDQLYSQANQFALKALSSSEAFSRTAQEMGLSPQAAVITKQDFSLRSLPDSREVIRNAFLADEENGAVTSEQGNAIFECGDNFCIAWLVRVTPKGYRPLSEVIPSIRYDVLKEKKGEMIKALLDEKGNGNLSEVASAVGGTVLVAEGISYESFSIPGLSYEPVIAAAASALKAGQTSPPLVGNLGVYLVKVTYSEPSGNPMNVDAEVITIENANSYRAQEALSILREKFEVTDQRIKFF